MRYKGLEVILKSVGPEQPLTEYANPDAPGDVFQRYVVSIAGQRFRIVVNVHQDFNWHHAVGLSVTWSAGSNGPVWRYYVQKNTHRMVPAIVISDFRYQEEGDTWLQGDLAFAEYEFDDSASYNAGSRKDADSKRGSIQVKVKRVSAIVYGEWKPYATNGQVERKAPIKIVKDKGIGHHVGALAPKPCDEGSREWTTTALQGQHGQQINYTFLYRPKHALQKQGICPRSPFITATEPVDLTALDDDDEDLDGDRVAEFVDLTENRSGTLPPKRERFDDAEDLEAEIERTKQRQRDLEAQLKRRGAGPTGNGASRSGTPRVKREQSHA